MRRLALYPWLLLAVALCCASCSGARLNTVQGKVLYQGRPAKGALVVFHPKGNDSLTAIPPTGVAGEDGPRTGGRYWTNAAPKTMQPKSNLSAS